jgi:hypothetical protein
MKWLDQDKLLYYFCITDHNRFPFSYLYQSGDGEEEVSFLISVFYVDESLPWNHSQKTHEELSVPCSEDIKQRPFSINPIFLTPKERKGKVIMIKLQRMHLRFNVHQEGGYWQQ